MINWALVQDGVVVDRRPSLPLVWGNQTGTNNWTREEAIAHSWFPYVESPRPDPGLGQVVDMTEIVEATQVVQSWTIRNMTPAEITEQNAVMEAIKDNIIGELDLDSAAKALFKMAYDHENRIRAVVRGLRAIATTAQRTTLDNQGVEAARPAVTVDQAKTAIRAML